MVYRRITVCLMAAVLFVSFVIGSSARPAVVPDLLPAFRIATPSVSSVITQDVNPEIARALHMSQPTGVLVSDIIYSPLRRGDVILSINGHPVGCEKELNEQLGQVRYGQPFFVEVLRNGRIQTVTVQRATETPTPPEALQGLATVESRGIRVATLSTQNGVIVTEVQIGTPSSAAGLKSGDVILEVDGHPVHTADEFLGFMRQLNNRDAAFSVQQEDGQINVFVIPA